MNQLTNPTPQAIIYAMSCLVATSERAAIGLHAVGILANNPGVRMTAKEIAAYHNVSVAHLAKVLRQLVRAGIVESVLGPGGGFILMPDAEQTPLLQVLQIIDGPSGEAACLFHPPLEDCTGCVYHHMAQQVNDYVRRFLGQLTIADAGLGTGLIAEKIAAIDVPGRTMPD